MRKFIDLMNWLSKNNVNFRISYLQDHGEGMLISTYLYTFETFDLCEEVMILHENDTNESFEISQLDKMYK